MIRLTPKTETARTGEPFVQTIELIDQKQTIARAIWHAAGDQRTAQLLELWVEPAHRRRGVGRQVMDALVEQVAHLNAGPRREQPIRVIWTVLAQKAQLPARAFLTRHSFHHVGTSKHLYLQDDAMMYARALD